MPILETHPAIGPDVVPIQVDDTDFDGRGHQGTVIRDADGSVVFPSYLPPEVETLASPESPGLSELSELSETSPASPPAPSGPPLKARTEPVDPKKKRLIDRRHTALPPGHSRPPIDKRWETEGPRRLNHQLPPSPPAMTRASTNISQLQMALWHQSEPVSGAPSSVSSSDDEDEDDEVGSRDSKAERQARTSEDRFRRFRVGNDNYRTKGKFSKKDGRLSISVKDTSNTGYLAKALGAAVKKVVPLKQGSDGDDLVDSGRSAASRIASRKAAPLRHIRSPRLNVVIMVIGSRGDAQPFLKIGKILKEVHGHRVRIATHPAFRDFVEKDSGLEFFSVGGDPSELMAFMVKNPGMIPTLETVRAGDIGRRRSAMAEMFEGFWRACINATDDEKDQQNLKMMGVKDPFIADAIIANPPSFAHIHCAEALGIPLHLMFTFPYTPTQAFPHPLASIKRSNVDPGYTNFISYPLVEMMVWQGLGDLVNDFRVKTLGLDPVSTLWAPGATYRLHVPFTYLWSPGLVPKPQDWGDEIDISGFVFLDLASSFKPPSELERFLAAGEAPIYIGFGSVVVDDADKFTEMIFEGVRLAGVRALVSKGWGRLGGGEGVPDNIFMLENTPHDWLFPKVRACVIHGGAGTTAISLKCGKPTMIVPFFGDQHFWGSMVGSAVAGPDPVPYKRLTAEKLADGIKYCLTEQARSAARAIAKDIEREGDGADNACKSFHRHLTLHGKHSMRCSVLEDRVAVWQVKNSNVRLSAVAADVAVDRGYLNWRRLRLIRHCEWNDFEGPGEPVTGIAGSLASSIGEVFGGIGSVPYRIAKRSNSKRERKGTGKERNSGDEKKSKDRKESKHRNSSACGMTPPAPAGERSDVKPVEGLQNGNARNHADPSGNLDTLSLMTDHMAAEIGVVDMAGEMATTVGRGVGKSASALARAPVDLSVALAQGFHNAPRLYGDDTVRRPIRVTGVRSGLRAARKEFVYGVYDGWTGLVRLPIRGARDSGGVRGFTKGVGMGVTGLVLKDIAAVIGPIGYTLKGLVKQMKNAGRQPIKHIRRARLLQGQRELRIMNADERARVGREVVHGWEVMQSLRQAIEEVKGQQGGFRQRLGLLRAGRRRYMGTAFQSVEVADQALASMRRGERLGDVAEQVRKSQDVRQRPNYTGDGGDAEDGEGEGEGEDGNSKPLNKDFIRGNRTPAPWHGSATVDNKGRSLDDLASHDKKDKLEEFSPGQGEGQRAMPKQSRSK